jgi:hypothetical protein
MEDATRCTKGHEQNFDDQNQMNCLTHISTNNLYTCSRNNHRSSTKTIKTQVFNPITQEYNRLPPVRTAGSSTPCKNKNCSRLTRPRQIFVERTPAAGRTWGPEQKIPRQISTGGSERKSAEERSTGRHPLTHEQAVGKATSGVAWEERSRP